MSKLRLLTLAIAASVGLSATAQAQTKIKIGHTGVVEALVYFVAIDEGFFQKHGIDAEIQILPSNPVLVPGIVSGEIQLGLVLAPVLIQAIDNGLPLVALNGIGVIIPETKSSAIIARTGSNIKAAHDLVGKRFLTGNLTSLPTIIAKQWLRREGIEPSGVTFVEVPMAQAGDVLRSGRADAANSPDPMLSSILHSKTAYVLKYAGELVPDHTATTVGVVSTDWAAKNPGALNDIKTATAEALAWAMANKQEAMRITAKHLDLKPELASSYAFPDLDVKLSTAQIQWWIDALKKESLIRSDVKPEQVLRP
jgi:NitT/TauT family transport system substrate-binding protein